MKQIFEIIVYITGSILLIISIPLLLASFIEIFKNKKDAKEAVKKQMEIDKEFF